MRIEIDQSLCVSSGMCAALLPERFALGGHLAQRRRAGAITALNVAVLPVTDVAASLDFHRDGLGLEVVVTTEPMPGRRWVELSFPGSDARIALVNGDGRGLPPGRASPSPCAATTSRPRCASSGRAT